MNNNTKKKKIMKRIIQSAVVALVCLVAFSVSALADNDKPVNVNQLPATAQQTLKKHFSAKKVALAIERAIPCKRVGVAVLGMEVPHTHIHLVPLNSESDLDFRKKKLELSPEEFKSIASKIAAEYEKL